MADEAEMPDALRAAVGAETAWARGRCRRRGRVKPAWGLIGMGGLVLLFPAVVARGLASGGSTPGGAALAFFLVVGALGAWLVLGGVLHLVRAGPWFAATDTRLLTSDGTDVVEIEWSDLADDVQASWRRGRGDVVLRPTGPPPQPASQAAAHAAPDHVVLAGVPAPLDLARGVGERIRGGARRAPPSAPERGVPPHVREALGGEEPVLVAKARRGGRVVRHLRPLVIGLGLGLVGLVIVLLATAAFDPGSGIEVTVSSNGGPAREPTAADRQLLGGFGVLLLGGGALLAGPVLARILRGPWIAVTEDRLALVTGRSARFIGWHAIGSNVRVEHVPVSSLTVPLAHPGERAPRDAPITSQDAGSVYLSGIRDVDAVAAAVRGRLIERARPRTR